MAMKTKILTLCALLAVGCLLVAACGEKEVIEPVPNNTTNTPDTPTPQDTTGTPDPQDTVPPAPIVPDFVGLDAWLNGTTWAVQPKEYVWSSGGDHSWRQFRQEYDPQRFFDRYLSESVRDTFYFDADTTYRISGLHTITGAYGLSADSVGTLDGYKRLYQISADSMIVYDWEPDDPLQYIESWLFTKVQ